MPIPDLPPQPVYYPGSTVRVEQLTGDFDPVLRKPTRNLTGRSARLVGTDLGSTFEHKGRLYFLFGDSWGVPGLTDAVAFSAATSPRDVDLAFLTGADGAWLPMEIPGLENDLFEVPSHGISVRGEIYVVFTADNAHGHMGASHLIVSSDDGRTWRRLYQLPNEEPDDPKGARFVNVWFERVRTSEVDGEEKDYVVMFASGTYRRSSVRLAMAEESQFPAVEAWRYFTGRGGGGRPRWSSDAKDAAVLFEHDVVGEFSCSWITELQRWVMLYNSSQPRGIVMRTAREPWGPFTDSAVIFDPWKDAGYGHFMHISKDYPGDADTLSDPGREKEWGGEYAPYLIPRFTTTEGEGKVDLYYVMSTWNPYQSVLMRSRVGYHPTMIPTVAESVTIKDWRGPGADAFRPFDHRGEVWTTTYIEGDRSMGWQVADLPRDGRNLRLRFALHGGDGEILLVERNQVPFPETEEAEALYASLKTGRYGRILRCEAGIRSNDVDLSRTWELRNHAGADLAVVVIDHLEVPWGFVSFSPVVLERSGGP